MKTTPVDYIPTHWNGSLYTLIAPLIFHLPMSNVNHSTNLQCMHSLSESPLSLIVNITAMLYLQFVISVKVIRNIYDYLHIPTKYMTHQCFHTDPVNTYASLYE